MLLPKSSSIVPSHRMVDKLQGSCLCKAITWELVNVYVSQLCICHCGSCQRHSGSSHLPFAAVERQRLWPLLQNKSTLKSYPSSSIATRYFCGTCGSPIVHDYHEEQYTLWIPMGSLVASTTTTAATDSAAAAAATTTTTTTTNCEDENHAFFDWEGLLDPSRDSHIFCNDQASYETKTWQALPKCLDFGLYKQDPCQPHKEWKDIPIFESTVQYVNDHPQGGTTTTTTTTTTTQAVASSVTRP